MNLGSIRTAAPFAMGMYVNEPCRICGEMITFEETKTIVFAGYATDPTARTAHKECWDSRKNDKANWAYPHDGVKP